MSSVDSRTSARPATGRGKRTYGISSASPDAGSCLNASVSRALLRAGIIPDSAQLGAFVTKSMNARAVSSLASLSPTGTTNWCEFDHAAGWSPIFGSAPRPHSSPSVEP